MDITILYSGAYNCFLMIYHLQVLHRFVDFFLDIQYLQPFPCVDICPCFLLILGSHLLFFELLVLYGKRTTS